ncbi:glucosidase II beta subunit-like protein-domain-containing protein [Apiosordaria backusii]|uniref:Endoplasmic reticulum lectin n=1 Tax=Apiosordaria backusii TaxID=314023 RepID=A0AA40ANC3_9PEZI|nr:glucosidase II beta subunit-like protein-domain-containing protein [Apiosordaria backusii]
MRRLNLVLLASLQLCRARQPSFSIHEDLLAHPQFEIVFSDQFISEADALALLDTQSSSSPAPSATPSSQTELASPSPETNANNGQQNPEDTDDDSNPVSETYELINSSPWKYLCTVPVLAPPPTLNQTATELAKAEEAREMTRASAKGWELMSGLEGHCLYFMSGWWSYSFCYGKDVVQFHALPRGTEGGPPVRDESSQEYVLGRALPASDRQQQQQKEGQEKGLAPPNSELQVKGDQRYLVQKFEGGTICDLTNKPRTIEVQYHCHPGVAGDRISWIKEVTICTYLMVVQTPRLCDDVAFLPPKVTRRHPVTCKQIVSSEEEESAWRYQKQVEAGGVLEGTGERAKVKVGRPSGGVDNNPFSGMTIGGVVVGGHKILGGRVNADGTPAFKLMPPRHIAALATPKAASATQVLLAKEKEGAPIDRLSPEKLEELGIEESFLDEMEQKLEAVSGGEGWRLEVVDAPGQERQYVVYQMLDNGADAIDLEKKQTLPPGGAEENKKGEKRKTTKKQKPKAKKAGGHQGKTEGKKQQKDEEEGSREEFKDEL